MVSPWLAPLPALAFFVSARRSDRTQVLA